MNMIEKERTKSVESHACVIGQYLPACEEVPVLGGDLTDPGIALDRLESLRSVLDEWVRETPAESNY